MGFSILGFISIKFNAITEDPYICFHLGMSVAMDEKLMKMVRFCPLSILDPDLEHGFFIKPGRADPRLDSSYR